MSKVFDFFVVLFIGIALGILLTGFLVNADGIKSDHKIEPTLKITITEGVADTTYIYRLGETE